MAVSEQTPYIEYTANGTTTSFALDFDCDNQNHLIVLVDDIEPVVGTWSLSSGAVVFNTAPENGKKITIQRNTPFSRTTDYQSYNNSFRPPAVNNDFDRVWFKIQELGFADWALRQYVDKKDNELKAFLLAEIQAQGVALDQLDEYYNYLMQRLAQIAVDQGWDASFVVDGDKNQKQINADVYSSLSDRYTKAETYSKPEIDTSLIAIAGGHKAYQTLAAAQAAQASLPANTVVEVTNDGANNGTYQWNGTTLTKSGYDPLTQAKEDATTKANTAEANAKNYTDSKTPDEHISPYPFSISDEGGNPILKIKKDGTLVVGAVEDKNGLVGSSGVPLDKIFNNISQLDIFINHGQSNGSGGVPSTPPVTATQEYNNALLNGGVISDLVIAPDNPEVPAYKMMNHLSYMTLRDTSLDTADLSSKNGVFTIARSGTGIVQLYNPAFASWRDFEPWLISVKAFCDSNGITCNVKAMLFTHGEFDTATMTVDEYLGHQYALYNQYNNKVKEITGQKNDMKFLTWQLNTGSVPTAQVKAHYQHPNMLVCFPKYCSIFADGTHMSAIGTAIAGAYYAKAYRYHFEQGKDWQPLMHTNIRKYGTNAVKVSYTRKGLTFDSSRFNTSGGGFYGSDTSGSLTVSSYEVNSSSDVIITFNRDIVGDLTFGYGLQLSRTDSGNLKGGTLRDNDGLFEKTLINGTEYPLHNWALSFEEVVK